MCRACQGEECVRECCLCPIKGGALKPTNIEGVWAHVMCAFWVPETRLRSTQKMEPVEGLESVPLHRFKTWGCSICRLPQGAVIQCCAAKCGVCYHPMCARKAGLVMKVEENTGVKGTATLSTFCPKHR